MRKLYRSTSWRRVISLAVAVFMLLSVLGTSGYTVFAEDFLDEGVGQVAEEVVTAEPEEATPAEEETVEGESPGEEVAEAVEETEAGEEVAETVEDAEEEAEEPAEEPAEEAAEEEEAEEPAEAAEEEAEEGEEAEEAEAIDEEAAEDEEEEAEEAEELAEEAEDTLVAEAAQAIIEDDGSEAPEEEAEEAEVVEEAAEEAAPEEEVIPEGPTSFPAAKFGGTTVTVTAEPYTFPEGTTVTIEEITLGRTQMAAVANAVEEEIVSVKAYDITFFDADGNEIQPAIPVKVSIDSKSMTDMDNLQVVHIEDNNKKATVVDDVDETKGGIEFDAEHFSVYVVVEVGEGARLAVTFKNGETEIDTMYVKAADLDPDHVADILCDPGAGNVPEGCIFLGWVEESVYEEVYKNTEETFTLKAILESENKPLSIDDIRAAAKTTVSAADFHESEVVYQALILRAFTITYFGEKITNAENEEQPGVALGSTTLLVSPSAEQGTTLINMSYTPKGDTQHFEGWNVAEDGSAENIVSASAEAPYPNNTEITINGDVNLQVYAPFGLWLIFSEQLKGATYNAPQFVITGSVTQKPCEDEDMLCVGHRFLGWFADPDGEEAFEFGHELTKKTTIYACWEEYEEASYTVVIWKQHVTGDKYDFVDSITLTGEVNQPVDTVVESSDGTYVTVNGTAYVGDDMIGSHLKDYDKDVNVKSDGTTIVNVYYDRDIITLNFYTNGDYTYTEAANGMYGKIGDDYVGLENASVYKADGNIYTGTRYTVATNNQGTQYGIVDGAVVQLTRQGNPGNRYWTYNGTTYEGTRYLTTTGNNGTQYGFVNGSMVQLTRDTVLVVADTQEPYEGTRYSRQYVAGWVLHDTMEGRYGSTLADNGETWPSEYRWNANQDGTGTTTTFLDAFLPTNNSTTLNFYGQNTQSGKTVIFYKQNADGNGYTEANRVNAAQNSTFYISDKYNGFVAYQYSTNGTTWTSVGNKNSNGYYNNGVAISFDNTLHIRFNRLTYAINFMDGSYFDGYLNPITDEGDQGQLHEPITGIAYGADISEYEDAVKPTYAGYSFAGWFVDKACTVLYDFDTLPEGGITVYAKWIQHQYRVFLHPQVPGVPTDPDEREAYLEWGDGVSLCFRVSPGETISVPTGIIKDGEYEMVGWFLDKDCETVFNKEDFLPNDSSVKTPYDKTKDMTDPMDKYGEIGENPSNSDATGYDGEDRFWITTKLDLYAKWRAVLVGAEGICIEYKLDGGSGDISDPLLYKDSAAAVAQDAPTPANDTLRFLYWDVQKWDEDSKSYVSSGVIVNPGEAFTVLKANACIEELEGSTEENPKFSYTIRLMAKYGPAEVPAPTHILWYDNYADCADPVVDNNLEVNEAVDIEEARTREGYTFLGWARVNNNTQATPSPQNLTENDLFLFYNAEDGKFYTSSDFNTEAKQVAADERLNYHDLYAVWKVNTYTVTYTVDGEEYHVDEEVPYGSSETLYDKPAAREGYTFNGWNSEDVEISNNGFTMPAKDVTITGTWSINSHKVTYSYTGDVPSGAPEVPAEASYNYGATVPAAAVPTMEGYTFSGWTGEVTTMPDNDVSVTGSWTINSHKVTYSYTGDVPDGAPAVPAEASYNYGATVPAAAVPTMEGYTFSGWTGEVTTMPDNDVSVTGSWTINQYTVTFVDEDGETVLKEAAKYDYGTAADDIVKPADPTKEGSEFTGWKPTIVDVTEDAVYTATYDAITYDVIYHSNYMNGDDVIATSEAQPLNITILSPDNVKADTEEGKFKGDAFTTGLKWTDPETEKTYQFLGWSLAPKGDVVYQPGNTFNGKADNDQTEQNTVTPADGTATTAGSSLRTLLAVVATSSKAKDSPLELYAEWGLVTITKETTSAPANGTAYKVGEVITYKITVTNDGSQPVTNIKVTDELTGDEWTVDKLGAGDSEEFEATYTATQADANAGKVKNVADATIEKEDPNDPDVPVTPGEKEDPVEKPTTKPDKPDKPDKPEEEPDEPIDDPDTPLAPAEEEPDEPIDDGDTPLSPYEEEPDEEVAEEPTPFSPYTGDDRHTAVWGLVSLLSLAGIAVVARKRREEE